MPPHSSLDRVETLDATFEKESTITDKLLALSEDSKEPESEIVRFFAGVYFIKIPIQYHVQSDPSG